MGKPGVMITIKVKGCFETTQLDISNLATIRDVKNAVRLDQNIPVCAQKYFYRGHIVFDDEKLRDIGVGNGSSVTMCVNSRFIERVHPFNLRDPLTGLLPKNAISCSDLFWYDQSALDEWKKSLEGQRLTSPMTGLFMNVGQVNAPLQDNVKSYVNSIQDFAVQDDYLSMDSLGRTWNIFGHFHHVVGRSPRKMRPRIVCLGNESIGKSAQLERLTFMCLFPRGEERCTRIPIEIRCHRGPKANPVFRVISGRGMGTESDEEEDARENGSDCLMRQVVALQKGAEVMQQQMSIVMDRITADYASPDLAPEMCVDRYIVLDVTGPTVADVTFVDYPGMAANDRELLVEMLTHEFERFGEQSIYLHITKASEFTEDGPYAILQGFAGGQLLDQTVGVVTQMDLADHIPDQPDRTRQLIDLALGKRTAERDKLFTCGTFLVMNKDEKGDPPSGFESVYLRAEREKTFLTQRGWLNPSSPMRDVVGSNAVIKQIQRMYFQLIQKSWLPTAMANLQNLAASNCIANAKLGLPPMVCRLPKQDLQPMMEQITAEMVCTLQAALPALVRKFDLAHVEPLEMALSDILEQTYTIPRLEVDQYIRKMFHDIVACFADRKEEHLHFWQDELRIALLHDASAVKIGRFTKEIAVLVGCLSGQLAKFYSMLQERYIDAFDVNDVTDKFECNIRPCRSESDEVPMVQLSFNIDVGTLTHIMCDSVRVFVDLVGNLDSVREVLGSGDWVECNRIERFDIWNEQRLIHAAHSELLAMAHEYGSTYCVMCPGSMVSLFHPRTLLFLECSADSCTAKKHIDWNYCALERGRMDDPLGDNLSQIESVCDESVAARFEIVNVGWGHLLFRSALSGQYLTVDEGEVKMFTVPENCSLNSYTQLFFSVEFQCPVDPLTASRAVSLYHIYSKAYIKASTDPGQHGRVTAVPGTLSDGDADAVFLVVANPSPKLKE